MSPELLDLPDDVLAQVMPYLSVDDLLACRLACKQLGRVAFRPEAWRRRRLDDADPCVCAVLGLAPCLDSVVCSKTTHTTTLAVTRCAVSKLVLRVEDGSHWAVASLILHNQVALAASLREQGAPGGLRHVELWHSDCTWEMGVKQLLKTINTCVDLETIVISRGLESATSPTLRGPSGTSLRYFRCELSSVYESFVNSVLHKHADSLEEVHLSGWGTMNAVTGSLLAALPKLQRLTCEVFPGMTDLSARGALTDVALSVCPHSVQHVQGAADLVRQAHQLRSVSLEFDLFGTGPLAVEMLMKALAAPERPLLERLSVGGVPEADVHLLVAVLPRLPALRRLLVSGEAADNPLLLPSISPVTTPALQSLELAPVERRNICVHSWLHREAVKTVLTANPLLHVHVRGFFAGNACEVCAQGCHPQTRGRRRAMAWLRLFSHDPDECPSLEDNDHVDGLTDRWVHVPPPQPQTRLHCEDFSDRASRCPLTMTMSTEQPTLEEVTLQQSTMEVSLAQPTMEKVKMDVSLKQSAMDFSLEQPTLENMEITMARPTLEGLAEDALVKVLQYLPVNDLLACRFTCRRLADVIRLNKEVWRHRRINQISQADRPCRCALMALVECLDSAEYSHRCSTAFIGAVCAVRELVLNLQDTGHLAEAALVLRNQDALGRLRRVELKHCNSTIGFELLLKTLVMCSDLESICFVGQLPAAVSPTFRGPTTPSLRQFRCTLDSVSEIFVNAVLASHAATLEEVDLPGPRFRDGCCCIMDGITWRLLAAMPNLRKLACVAPAGLEEVVALFGSVTDVTFYFYPLHPRGPNYYQEMKNEYESAEAAAEFIRRASQLRSISICALDGRGISCDFIGGGVFPALVSPNLLHVERLSLSGSPGLPEDAVCELQSVVYRLPALRQLSVPGRVHVKFLDGISKRQVPILRSLELSLETPPVRETGDERRRRLLLSLDPVRRAEIPPMPAPLAPSYECAHAFLHMVVVREALRMNPSLHIHLHGLNACNACAVCAQGCHPELVDADGLTGTLMWIRLFSHDPEECQSPEYHDHVDGPADRWIHMPPV